MSATDTNDLHFVDEGFGFYSLSRRISSDDWNDVKRFFVYWSEDDFENMDYFGMEGGWYIKSVRPEPGVFLNGAPPSNPKLVERVEEILGILPENRMSVMLANRDPRAVREPMLPPSDTVSFHDLLRLGSW